MSDLGIAREIGVSIGKSASVRSSQSDFAPRHFSCQGEFLIEMPDSTGEVTRDLVFPVTFIERPLFFDGGTLEESQSVTIGSIPTINGIVISWDVQNKGLGKLYKGARVGVVMSGDASTRFWYHWRFDGLALVNPIAAGATTVDGVI